MSRQARPRGATGSRVGGGRLRVDAARAVGKLRDYQLADPAMWALEAIRAAAALGASAVHLDGDADDVWVAWEGEPLAAADLPRLLDELVSPEARDERRALRLLATALNTALGLGPRFVDVYAIDEGAGVRARYAPQLLRATESGAAEGLRQLVASRAAIPAGAPAVSRGALLHLRRFPALEALSLLATGQEPREMRIARRACEDFPIPLRIGHGPLAPHHAGGDLLRVRLDAGARGGGAHHGRAEGGGRDAFLAITEIARLEPYVDYAELGVVLATQPLALPLPIAPGARVPIRARIDAPRLPTNASRSAVRREEPWCRAVEERLAAALPELVARLVRELGPDAEAEWAPKAHARLRAAAIVLAAAPIAGADWREALAGDRAPEVLAPLYDAPIARDAIGRARSIGELARGGHAVVHTGATALPEELAPWVGDVPWVAPGDPIGRLWGASPPPTAEPLIEQAHASREARARWLERPAVPPVLEAYPGHVVVVPLKAPGPSARSCVPEGVLARPGLSGEIAIVGAGGSRGEISLLVDGRETEVSRRESPIGFRARATSPSLRLVPSHDAVADDDAKRELLLACSAAVVVGCEAIARHALGRRAPNGETARFAGEPPDGATAARLVRAGTRVAVQVLERATRDGKRALLESKSPLLEAPAWPTASGAMASLAAIVLAARGKPGMIGWLSRAPARPFEPEGRIVLVLDEHERELVELLVGADALIDYRGHEGPSPSAESIARSIRAGCIATLAFERRGSRGAIGWAREGTGAIRVSHLGVELATTRSAPDTAWPAILVIDDDRAVPNREWRALRFDASGDHEAEARELEGELAAALVDAMAGRERADLHAPPLRPFAPAATVDALLAALGRMSAAARAKIRPESVRLLRDAPLFTRAFTRARVSMSEACASLGGELVHVAPEIDTSGPRLDDFDPVVLRAEAAAGVAALFGARVRNGADDLARRQVAARYNQRLAALRARSPRALELPDCAPVVRIRGQGVTGLLGLGRRASDRTRVEVRIEGRHLCETHEPLPGLEAIVDGDPALADDELVALSDPGLARVRGAIREATASLIIEIVGTIDRPLAHHEVALALVRAWCESPADRKRGSAKRVIEALRAAPIFATIQGSRASIADASPGKQVKVAEPVDRWLGPAPGEKPGSVDSPILAYPTDENDPVRVVLRSVAEHSVRNVTTDVRRVIAERRVKHGISGRPRIPSVPDERFRWTLEELAEIAPPTERATFEALGIGEICLARAVPSRVSLFESGTLLESVVVDIRPPVAIACEPPALRIGRRGITPKDHERLDGLARTVVARALRRLVETIPPGTLPSWVRAELRTSALLGGPSHLAAISDVPVFETSAGRWVSPREVQSQAERLGVVWWTSMPVGTVPEPLDPERIVLRLEPAEAAQLAPWAKNLRADDELRLDAIARANRDRPPASSIGPTHHETTLGLGVAELEGGRGTVIALHPAHVASRGLRVYRERRALGTVPDGSGWPVLAWVDEPELTPDRTWSSPVDDATLGGVRAEVAEACESALAEAFAVPSGVIATVRVDRPLSDAAVLARGIAARGVLAIPLGDEPSIEVIDATGESERVARVVVPRQVEAQPLPLSGRLAITGVAGPALSAALAAIGRVAYARMVRVVGARVCAGSSPDRDVDVAELVRAAALGLLEDGDPSRALALGFVLGTDPSLGALSDALARGETLLVVPPEKRGEAIALARELGHRGPVIVDDGTLPARRAITAARSVPLARLVSDAVLADAPPATRELAQRTAPPQSAASAKDGARPRTAAPREREASARKAAAAAAPSPSAEVLAIAKGEIALAGRLETRIAERGASATRVPITVDLLASGPLASLRPGGEVELALRHPLVLALERRPDHDEGLAILAAHVIGVASRGDDDAIAVELQAITRLLGK